MAPNILAFTIYELLLSTIFGLLSIYLGQSFMCRLILGCSFGEAFERKNTPLAIFGGALILCITILTMASILPSVSFLQVMASGPAGLSFAFFLKAFLYFLLFFAISFVSAMILLFLSSKVIMIATKDIDEIKEISQQRYLWALLWCPLLSTPNPL